MSKKPAVAASIDVYIAGFTPEVRVILQQIRATIRKAAPRAEETIKYGMPTYMQDGNLVFFAAFKNHVGFFGGSTDGGKLTAALAPYSGPKGSLKFAFDKPVPIGLIRKIVQARVRENRARADAKKKR